MLSPEQPPTLCVRRGSTTWCVGLPRLSGSSAPLVEARTRVSPTPLPRREGAGEGAIAGTHKDAPTLPQPLPSREGRRSGAHRAIENPRRPASLVTPPWVASIGLALAAMLAGCGPGSPDAPLGPATAPTTGPSATRPSATPTQPKPMRIASVMLAADEILFDLVGPDRLVAVTVYADDGGYSNLIGRLPKQLPRIRAEIESVLSVRPDLVCVSEFNRADFLELLNRSGLRYYRNVHCHTLAEIRAGVLRLGDVVGEPEQARRMVARMDARLSAVAQRLAGVTRRPRVLHWSGGWTSGAASTVQDMIEAAGGRNAAAAIGLKGPCEIATEKVLELNPDTILVSAGPNETAHNAIEQHPVLSKLRAVAGGRIIRMPGRYLLTISHHIVGGVEFLARRLHPERFGDAGQKEARDP